MIKTVYAQSGKPGVSRIEFVELWRAHGTRAMLCHDYFGHVARYVQSDVLTAPTEELGSPLGFFGVGELCYPDRQRRDLSNASASRRDIIVPHGQALFGSPHPVSHPCEERIIQDHHRAPIKVYAFLKRVPSLSRDAFLQQWRESAGRVVGLASYVQSRSIDENSSFDGLDELYFDRVDDARAFLVRKDSALRTGWSNLCDLTKNILLVTEQVVMYDRANYV